MRVLLAIVVLLIIGAILAGRERAAYSPDAPSNPWHTGFDVNIAKGLAAIDAKGCGEFAYKFNESDSEYLVRCYDGSTTRYYVLWPKIGKGLGPYDSPPSF